jgi:predicted anti-sigma-YlaC factor YlaD
MFTCQQVLDFLSDYVDGRLSASELAPFDEHLAVCPQCVDYFENFKATLAACRSLRNAQFQTLPPLPEKLVHAIVAARTDRSNLN